jgi:adenylate cyclase
MLRRFLPVTLIGLGAALLAIAVAQRTEFGERFEGVTYDERVRYTARPETARDDIVIIEIDEQSMRALEPIYGRWPWPRLAHGAVIDFLSRAPARVIAYDVLFSERHTSGEFKLGDSVMTGAQSDDMFVAAVRRAGNVVLAVDATTAESVAVPFDAARNAAALLGHNRAPKEFGVSRTLQPFVDLEGAPLPSLGLAAAAYFKGVPATQVALPADRPLLRFRGQYLPDPPGTPYPVFQFYNVLLSAEQQAGGQTPLHDPSVFRDKIVFVGVSAAALFDAHTAPVSEAVVPGVFLHATATDNVLAGDFMRRASWKTDAAIAVGVGLLAAIVATTLPVWGMVLAVTALVGTLVAGATLLVGQGLWVGVVAPVLAAVVAVGGSYTWRYVIEDREKRRVKKLFGRYVSKDVFEQLMANPSLAQLGGHRREMTVLFTDIRGFTTASEKSTPEAVVTQLNEYFGEMVEILFRHRGTLDKFVGDMVMGLFGAPVTDALHADNAVQCALEMIKVLEQMNARWTAQNRPRLDIGIGISSGVMIAGNIGSSAIMSYTVIGDAVNLGARLESLNKEYGTRILMSEATKARLTLPVQSRRIGDVTVKGKTQPVGVYEVQG